MSWSRRSLWSIAAIACGIFMITACRSELLPATVKVDPGAVEEVRAVGKFIAATSTDGYWDGETQITDVIIIDAASSSAAGALIKTSNLLKKSNWKTVGQNSDWIQMESDKWPGVEVTLESFASYGADTLMEDSRVAKAIRETLAHAKPESLIVADIGPAE